MLEQAGSIHVPRLVLAKQVAVLGIACKISVVHSNGCTGLLTYLFKLKLNIFLPYKLVYTNALRSSN